VNILVREPTLEWLHRTAAGEHDDLSWVDSTIENHPPFRVVEPDLFQHVAYVRVLPPALVRSAADAQLAGRPTLLEAMILLFAPMEWMSMARGYLWSPMGPTAGPLALLVESMGVGPEIHEYSRDALANLLADSERWLPTRGSVETAAQIIESAQRPTEWIRSLADQNGHASEREPDLTKEIFVGWSEADWTARESDEPAEFRVEDGFLLFQASSAPCLTLPKSDFVVSWSEAIPYEPSLRLLAAWLTPRFCLPSSPAEHP
jgi:hypothetical protein